MNTLKVSKQVLDNGLTILSVPRKIIPKVSIQLWYNVGSKDEKSGQKGIAHLIEHMIFKGTATLSECDISLITHKLSGYCNAFTSYDYTGYLFDFPSQHWQEALPIMADCMQNCTFKQELLNSELKAVIQELKMYKDDYISTIFEQLISTIFPDHPYHHPIIGYKQDLWNLDRNTLVNFYKTHYIPNNATLVVVGDVNSNEVFEETSKYFNTILPQWDYKKQEFYHSPDLRNYNVTIYRDVKQPLMVFCWVVPGARKGEDYLIDTSSWIVGLGKGSRLYKKLIDELDLVTDLETYHYDLFDYGLLFIYFQPKNVGDFQKIKDIINWELESIVEQGIQEAEISRAIKKTEMDYLSLLEDNQKQAYAIGKYYLAMADENFVYKYTEYPKENLEGKIRDFTGKYLIPGMINEGIVLPLNEKEKKVWLHLQEVSDQEDERILAGKKRFGEIEEGKCVYDIKIKSAKKFNFPRSQIAYLENGLKLLYYNNILIPKIDFILDFKIKYYYDPENLQGLCWFVSKLLEEGTKNYSATEFANTLESFGMNLNTYPGYLSLSMLAQDLSKGLELVNEMLVNAAFKEESIEKVRDRMIAELNHFWDQPIKFVNQLAKEEIYKNHPYSKNSLGTFDGLKNITRQDLIDFYKKFLSPQGSRLALTGNIVRYEVKQTLNHMLSGWVGKDIPEIDFPKISVVKPREINYPIMRDQIVLCYAGLSSSRLAADYDKLLLFDQIFTGGVLGSMSSRLFDLREQTGLFYTIGGSLVYNIDKQPGMIIIKTVVSGDRLNEAERAIENVINTAIDNVTDDEFEQAKRAIINSLVDNFSTNYKIAVVSIIKDEYNLPDDYFDKRPDQINGIKKEEMQEVVRKYLSTDKMIKIRVGRI